MRTRFIAKAALILAAVMSGCQRKPAPPTSQQLEDAVEAFQTGIAAVQVGEDDVAETAFQRVTQLVPQEPAGWANLGLVALQQEKLDSAASRLAKARSLASSDSRIALLSALVARAAGNDSVALHDASEAARLDPHNLQALYLAARMHAESGGADATARAQQALERILSAQPDNLAVLVERARLAAGARDTATLNDALVRMGRRLESRPASAAVQLREIRQAAASGDFARAATQTTFLATALEEVPGYRADRDKVVISPARTDVLLTRFVRLPMPAPQAAPPDTGMRFTPTPLAGLSGSHDWVHAVWLSDATPLSLLTASADTVWLAAGSTDVLAYPFPGAGHVPQANAIAPLDYNYDFRTDLVLAGGGGLRLLQQKQDGTFSDMTAAAIPAAAVRGRYSGAWAADLDMDGDLDLVIARAAGAPLVLINDGNGKFEPRAEFPDIADLRAFVWADLEDDGAPAAVLLDAAGKLHVFHNRRGQTPQFVELALPDSRAAVQAMAVADLDKDTGLDLIVLQGDGAVTLLSMHGQMWRSRRLTQWPAFTPAAVGASRMLVSDVDNNGELDLLASTPAGSRIWLAGADSMHALPPLQDRITAAADVAGTGRLDLLGASPAGALIWLSNHGTADYRSMTIRPRAASVTGDRRINPFGIGGEVEVRAGLLYQKQLISSPIVHFGLGHHKRINVARIIWPNGTSQAEFDLAATNQGIRAQQRLKGSCPWVFAFDGDTMRFVTDFIWRTALGLRINAQGETTVIHSVDWVRIGGDQLVPHDGYYDVRVTAELWESHFFDHIELMAVDHPTGTNVFTNELFKLPAPPPRLYALGELHSVARALDETGRDVSALVRARDDRYLDTFEHSPYQGLARDHYVEITLGDDAPANGPLWLVATGWVYPTDASINVAISEGNHPKPYGIRLEVADGHGGWVVANPDVGFPEGKAKTMLVDLHTVFKPGAARRLRLRTNMEVYWDRISWATELPATPLHTTRLQPSVVEIRYRGFSETHTRRRSDPEVPVYRIAGTAQRWRDLIGYYTRYGDVRALNEQVDDRYIIMNAGDEIRLRFPALPPPTTGWTRDFVLIGDGWAKDGDYNTGYSKTVRPLPYHGLTDYTRPPGRLENDPGYLRHPEDWKNYHTRYVAPQDFYRALGPERSH